jgi:serine/threonine protein kinase
MKICIQCQKFQEDPLEKCPHGDRKLIEVALSPDDDLIGKVLVGRFLILGLLGQGGMGKVYKAIHTKMERICALKFLSTNSANNERAIARFKREAKLASKINNPHAVAIYDFGQVPANAPVLANTLFLAMEYIEGETLTQLILKDSPMDVERVVRMTGQMAEGLAAAHSTSIIHRDIKPDNIMVIGQDGQPECVKVLDFGLAKSLNNDGADSMGATQGIMGTPPYMSPEQASGQSLDETSDVYSLAVVVYEMLSRNRPFQGNNAQVLHQRLTQEPIPLRVFNPSLSPAIENVVMSGLARERRQRIQTVKEFAAVLQQATVTRDFGSPQLAVDPEAEIVTAVLPDLPSPLLQLTPQQELVPTPKKTHRQIMMICLAMGLLVFALIATYFLTQTSTVPPVVSSTPPTQPNPDEKKAGDHFELGDKYQRAARIMADGKMRDSAAKENRKAIQEFTQAITLQPLFPEAHQQLAFAFRDDCNPRTALDEFRTAVEQYKQLGQMSPAKLHSNYALLLFDGKQYQEAANQFEQALIRNHEDVEIYAYLGFALQLAGEPNRAREIYDIYLKKDGAQKYVRQVQGILQNPSLLEHEKTEKGRCFNP